MIFRKKPSDRLRVPTQNGAIGNRMISRQRLVVAGQSDAKGRLVTTWKVIEPGGELLG
jgi:hypothetical protein